MRHDRKTSPTRLADDELAAVSGADFRHRVHRVDAKLVRRLAPGEAVELNPQPLPPRVLSIV